MSDRTVTNSVQINQMSLTTEKGASAPKSLGTFQPLAHLFRSPENVTPLQVQNPEETARKLLAELEIPVEDPEILAIMAGTSIDPLLHTTTSESVFIAQNLLEKLLSDERAQPHADIIENLAIYVVNWNNGFIVSDLFEKKLLPWMATHASNRHALLMVLTGQTPSAKIDPSNSFATTEFSSKELLIYVLLKGTLPTILEKAIAASEDEFFETAKTLYQFAIDLSKPAEKQTLLEDFEKLASLPNKRIAAKKLLWRLKNYREASPTLYIDLVYEIAMEKKRRREAVAAAEQPETKPVSQIDDIMAGVADYLAIEPAEGVLDAALSALNELLEQENAHEKADQIRNLSIYLANWDSEFLGKAEYQKLRAWMIAHEEQNGRAAGQDLQKEELFLLGLANEKKPMLYGDIAKALQEIHELQELQSKMAAVEPSQQREWAKKVLCKPKGNIEMAMQSMLKKALAAKNAPAMNYPALGALNPYREMPASLEDQLTAAVKEQGWGSEETYLTALGRESRTLSQAWTDAKAAREALIQQAIDEVLHAQGVAQELAAFTNAAAPHLPPTYTPIIPDSSEALSQLAEGFAVSRRENRPLTEDERTGLLEVARNSLRAQIETLTGLSSTEEMPEALLQYVMMHGNLPLVIHQATLLDGGKSALALSRLLYYFNALQEIPSKPQFSQLASAQAFDFLTNNVSPLIGAKRMLKLLKTLYDHEKFQGHVPSRHQAVLFSEICRLMRVKGTVPEEFHAKFGYGKSALAHLAVGFLKDVFPECREKRVILYGPSPIRASGIEYRKLSQGIEGNNYIIEVGSAEEADNVVVIVDDGRLKRGTKFLVRGPGVEKEVFPLKITATPTLPPKKHNMRKDQNFRRDFTLVKQVLTAQKEELEDRLEDLEPTLKPFIMKKQAEKLLEKLSKQFISSNFLFKPYIPPVLIESQLKAAERNDEKERSFLEIARDPNQTKRISVRGPFLQAEETLQHALGEVAKGRGNAQSLHAAIFQYRELFARILENDQESGQSLHSFTHLPFGLEHDKLKKEAIQFHKDLGRLAELIAGSTLTEQEKRTSLEYRRLNFMAKAVHESQEKLTRTMEGWTEKAQMEREAREYFDRIESERSVCIQDMQYQRRDFAPFEPAIAGQQIAGEIRLTLGDTLSHQVILPGVHLTKANISPFIHSFYLELADSVPAGVPVYFLYHDEEGEDWAIGYTKIGNEFQIAPIPLAELSKLSPGIMIMLYDTDFKQGGDYGIFSQAALGEDIHQHIFYNWSDNGRDPVDEFDAIDLHQMFGRRRGNSDLKPFVYASKAREAFETAIITSLNEKRQEMLLSDFAGRIARKLIKASMLFCNPIYTRATRETGAQSLFSWRKADIMKKTKVAGLLEHELPSEAELAKMVIEHLQQPSQDSNLSKLITSLAQQMKNISTETRTGIEREVTTGEPANKRGSENLWQAKSAFEDARLLIADWLEIFKDSIVVSQHPRSQIPTLHGRHLADTVRAYSAAALQIPLLSVEDIKLGKSYLPVRV